MLNRPTLHDIAGLNAPSISGSIQSVQDVKLLLGYGIAHHGGSCMERKSIKVLIAEDDLLSRELASHLFQERGHNVVTANNGKQALEILSREDFDLVIMDIQMPEMDGFTAARFFRMSEPGGYEANQRVPMFALTSLHPILTKTECRELGMSCISKPITPEKIERILTKALERPARGNA
jgi:CheY-like chemotaxis protein